GHVWLDQPGDHQRIASCLHADHVCAPQRPAERDNLAPTSLHPRMAADPTALKDRNLTEIAVHIQTDRTHHSPPWLKRLENGRANDNYGYVLAAQPGQSQGRPATTADSQSILEDLGLPNLRSPGSPGLVGTNVARPGHRDPHRTIVM